MSLFDEEPQKMSLVNLVTGASLQALYNPEELRETYTSVYAKQVVMGNSHGAKQFVHTDDVKLSFTMMFSAMGGPGFATYIQQARLFLQSMHYPRGVAGNVASAGPPRFLFIWPDLMSMTAVAMSTGFTHKRFRTSGGTVVYAAEIALESISDSFVSSDDVSRAGTEGFTTTPARFG